MIFNLASRSHNYQAQVIAPTLSDVLKVWTLKNDKIEGKVVATLPMEESVIRV